MWVSRGIPHQVFYWFLIWVDMPQTAVPVLMLVHLGRVAVLPEFQNKLFAKCKTQTRWLITLAVLYESNMLQTLQEQNNWKFDVPLSAGDSTCGQAFRAIDTCLLSADVLSSTTGCTQGKVICDGYSPVSRSAALPPPWYFPVSRLELPAGLPVMDIKLCFSSLAQNQ